MRILKHIATNLLRELQSNRLSAFCNAFSLVKCTILIFVSWVCLWAQVETIAQAQTLTSGPQVSEAPLNPDFIAWQQRVETFGFEGRDTEGITSGYVPSPFDRSHLQYQTPSPGLFFGPLLAQPAKFDLRESGHVTSVKSQGECGCCWTFATYGSLESWLLRNKGESWDFSENHLKNNHGFDFAPCGSGNADMSIAYLSRWAGPVNESDDPYHAWDDSPSRGGSCQKYVRGVLYFTTPSEIKDALMIYGALQVRMCWTWDDPYYNSSAYTYYYDGSGDPNHMVTLVGWDDNKHVSRAPGKGAWLIKNNWGTDFGENGYFYISYHDTIAVKEAVAFCDAVSTSSYMTNYQYDPLGQTSSSGYNNTTAWGANIFIASADELLDAVGFHALAKETSYEIYIYDSYEIHNFDTFDGISFQDDDLLGSCSGTVSYAGYHTVTLPLPIELRKEDDFVIVIKFTTPGYNYPIPTEKPIEGYSSGATANAGESYISSDGQIFLDITDNSPNTNICIKGLTILPSGTPPGEYQVSASDDDGYASQSSSQNLRTDYLKVGSYSGHEAPYYTSGMVFKGMNIPPSAEIISAYLEIRSYENYLTNTVYGKIQAQDTDNADSLSQMPYISARPRTDASVNWDHHAPWTKDTWYRSPDIADVIQEVVNRTGWSAGNSLAILYSTRLSEGGYRHFYSYDGGYAPKLLVTHVSDTASPLAEALDTSLNFTTGGSADWFAQTTTTRYDGDAAQSGDISHRQDTWMQTTVSGTGTVKFYWKVSSEEDFDFLEFYIDGSLQEKISGSDGDWEWETYTISTSGSHTLEWRYVKDGSGDSGSDCGWVDKVEW